MIVASFAALTIGLLAAPLNAQVLYGSIVGVVQDASGSTIPAATVSIVNKDTNLTRETVSNENGEYTLPNLQPGRYDVKVGLQGFREFVKTNVPVTAGQVSRVEARLEIGSVSETVTVESAAQLLQTDKSDLHTELKAKEIVNLPLNQYRNYQGLINLVPGATPASFQNAQTDTPGRSLRTNVNGSNGQNNNTRIDGASSVNIWLPHHTGYVAPAETIDTVNISTNNFDASQGMAGGAAITLVTKSGTNDLRGSAFVFRNQDELNARNFFDPTKLNSSVSIGGGTVGGPIVRNKLFYFGSYEGNYERNSRFDIYSVPTAKMRNGDFSEVLAVTPGFHIYDPATGNPTGRDGRSFPARSFRRIGLPRSRRTSSSSTRRRTTPARTTGCRTTCICRGTRRLTATTTTAKINFNRSAAQQFFVKFSTMQAQVDDLYKLGNDVAGGGITKVYVGTIGQTWTLSPKMVLDASVGMNKQNQHGNHSDFGTNFGSDTFGLPGTNGPDPRQSGLPSFQVGLNTLGNNDTWTPFERHETSYTVTSNLTRLMGAHEIRGGFDFIRYQLNHWQPELGAGPRGDFAFSGNITGQPGYTANNWNNYAAFLLGLDSTVSKSIQFEEMSGRENQYGLFISDRWNASPKMTVNLGLRYEYYPLMTRENRGLERLDYSTFQYMLGGLGNVPQDVGIHVSKALFAPRLGMAYRINEKTVFRTGYGMTYDPIPWSRPLRGFYPLTIGYSNSASSVFGSNYASFPLASGIPVIPLPDTSTGIIPMPRNVTTRSPNPNDVDRGRTHQWNVTLERQLPAEISVSAGYVGSATNGGYADQDLNWADTGGDAARQLFTQAGTAQILDWSGRTKSRYKALQVAINRPFKGGLLLKGAYTLSQAKNETDDDGWATLTWSQPSQLARNYALAGYDRTHNFQMGFLYEIPFAKNSNNPIGIILERLAGQRCGQLLLGNALHHRRRQHPAQSARGAADDRPGWTADHDRLYGT